MNYIWIPGAFTFLLDNVASDLFEIDDFLASFFFIMVCSLFQELRISYIIVVLGINLLKGFDFEFIETESGSLEGLIGTRS
jgi:hypothetical protein